MYLAETLEDADGVAYPMAGVLPAGVRMRPRRMALGYTEVALTHDTPIGRAGAVARGHEFHYSTLDPVPDGVERDRKSTRLNSSHGYISYAVFCLKKKTH